jgi:hypothetical protein
VHAELLNPCGQPGTTQQRFERPPQPGAGPSRSVEDGFGDRSLLIIELFEGQCAETALGVWIVGHGVTIPTLVER